MTLRDTIEQASQQIQRLDAEVLLLHVAGRDRAWLLAHPEAELSQGETRELMELVSRRAEHWPLQYLTGHQEFFGLDLQLSQDVLIPRPETELLVEAVLEWAESRAEVSHIVDVGTGSGAIGIALASRLTTARILAIDLSPKVQAVVESNAARAGVHDRVSFVESDLLSALAEDLRGGLRFDVVVSNPPYVPAGDAPAMQPEVRDFEPHLALFAGEDGLAVYRKIIPQAWDALRSGGLLAMEFGFGQRDELAKLLQGWENVRFRDDYAGIPRIVMAERTEALP